MRQDDVYILIHGDDAQVSKMYYAYRDAFLNFGAKYSLSRADLKDIYQEAFVALRDQALKGKLDSLNSATKTYLFGIGRYMIFDRLKELEKTIPFRSDHREQDSITIMNYTFPNTELSEEQLLLRKYFRVLGKKCQELLTLFYSRGLTIEEISELTDYANKNVVKSQKSRCINAIKTLVKQHGKS